MLVACHAPSGTDEQQRTPAASAPQPVEEIVHAQFRRRLPNTRMTRRNMPYFNTVTYCRLRTRDTDEAARRSAYADCIELQYHSRLVIGEGIDGKKFAEADIVRCARASHTAYEGMWYCMNGQPFR
jgi:hypothetical protein